MRTIVLVVVCALLFLVGGVQAKTTPAQKCESTKLTAAEKRGQCLLKAHAKAVLTGKPLDLGKCAERFLAAFAKAEQKGGAACPTRGDADAVAAQVDEAVTKIADGVAGSTPTPTQTPPPVFPYPGQVWSGQYRTGHKFVAPPGTAGTVNYSDPARTLVMPFDVTDKHLTFLIASRIAGDDPLASAMVATHWNFWSDNGDHLADVFICLTPNDTTVVDPRALQGQTQIGLNNVTIGPIISLAGTRGFAVVTALMAQSSNTCAATAPDDFAENQLVGSWLIADTVTNASYAHTAIGIGAHLPDPTILNDVGGGDDGLVLQTFAPNVLQSSRIILIGLEENRGFGQFDKEIGPIARLITAPGTPPHACCDGHFVDNLGTSTSIPDICFQSSGWFSITESTGEPGDPVVIPPTTSLNTSGQVVLTGCETADSNGDRRPIGASANQFIYAFHAQGVGPFQ